MSFEPAGYSGTPLPKKLGVKPGSRVLAIGAPAAVVSEIARITPVDALDSVPCSGLWDVILLFAPNRANFEASLPSAQAILHPDGGLWIAWPKKSSGVRTDMTEDYIREIALPRDLVDNKVCAIDATWSGLRFVVPVAKRAGIERV
jgi:hypothetical protein